MASQSQLTATQKQLANTIDKATSSVLAYAASVVPPLENLTKQGMLEELGYMNEARKAIEKTEKIIKERLKSRLDAGETEMRSDNFQMTYENRERCALDQTKAKSYLEQAGILEEYMATTQVPTMTIKRL